MLPPYSKELAAAYIAAVIERRKEGRGLLAACSTIPVALSHKGRKSMYIND